ncbi:putative ABC transport system ATP-binding protein [Frankineae bacterium MT45]|nr:putative ABC transport system ATP-binding protein [Frankineae bacterium MT45]
MLVAPREPDWPVVRVRGATRVFRDGQSDVSALRGIDLDLAAGEFVAVVGSSGSGKSTLLNILSGIDSATSGLVEVLGMDLARHSANDLANLRLHKIGFVFQNINLLPDLTILENVALPLEAAGATRKVAALAAAEKLEVVGILSLGNRYPGQVSGGERQRAAIARAVVGERRLLLADEPTGALDSANTEVVIQVLRDVCELGIATLVCTHNDVVAIAADRRLRLVDGAFEGELTRRRRSDHR